MVIGGGYIGIEIGTLYAKLGAKVTVVEALPAILPGTDPELAQVVARKLKKLGVEVLTGAKAKGWTEKGDRARGHRSRPPGARSPSTPTRCWWRWAAGPTREGLGLEAVGVKVERGFVPVDRRMRTNVPGIYAIGDVAGQPMLAHKASHEAEVVAEVIAGHKAEMDVRMHPRRHLQRSGDRHRRHHRRGGREARAARSRSASSPSRRWGAPSPTPTPTAS